MVSKRMIVIAAMSAAVVGMVAGNAYAQQSATPPGERFVLTGVVHVEGGRGVAWLQEPTFTNNQIVTVRPGDSVGPYRVTKILEDKVELVGPGGTVFVPLAGAPGTVSVAASPETKQPSVHELPPHPALKNPEAIVISRGDPRRNFPASDLLIGAGALVDGILATVLVLFILELNRLPVIRRFLAQKRRERDRGTDQDDEG